MNASSVVGRLAESQIKVCICSTSIDVIAVRMPLNHRMSMTVTV